MRKYDSMARYLVALCVFLVAWVSLVAVVVTHHSQPCLLPSVDAGYTASEPLVCVNTGNVATSQDIAAGAYSQEECKPNGHVPCVTVRLALVWKGGCDIIETSDMASADALVRYEDYIPVPANWACPSVTIR